MPSEDRIFRKCIYKMLKTLLRMYRPRFPEILNLAKFGYFIGTAYGEIFNMGTKKCFLVLK